MYGQIFLKKNQKTLMHDYLTMNKNRYYQKNIDELLSLTEKALHYVEKKDLSRALVVSIKRKKLISKLEFISVPSDNIVSARYELKNIQDIDASIRKVIETELEDLKSKVNLTKKELMIRDRFVGGSKRRRRIIDAKL
jgi:hypothetical protein